MEDDDDDFCLQRKDEVGTQFAWLTIQIEFAKLYHIIISYNGSFVSCLSLVLTFKLTWWQADCNVFRFSYRNFTHSVYVTLFYFTKETSCTLIPAPVFLFLILTLALATHVFPLSLLIYTYCSKKACKCTQTSILLLAKKVHVLVQTKRHIIWNSECTHRTTKTRY